MTNSTANQIIPFLDVKICIACTLHHFLKQLPHCAISSPGPSLDVGKVISKTKKTYTPCHDKGQHSQFLPNKFVPYQRQGIFIFMLQITAFFLITSVTRDILYFTLI